MKILVLGSNGQLGRCLNDQLKITDHEVIYTHRESLDISDFESTNKKILNIYPDIIINATAYTAVDEAEKDKKMADLINHLAVKNIANICTQIGCWLIHISTDYVFDGNSNTPYKEDDKTNPQSIYGETKLKGEMVIQSSGCKYIIVRTAWIFSEHRNNFLKTMLELGEERDEISIIADQIGCPTYAQDIARSINKIINKLDLKEGSCIYHFCGDRSCSWYEFASIIFDQAKEINIKVPSTINPIQTSDFPTPAKRPLFSVLDCSRINNDFGIHSSNWHNGIKEVLTKLKDSNAS